MAQGPYRIPRIGYDVATVVTNTTPMGAFRGAGRPEAAAFLERIIDMAADELGLDPVEIRRRNFLPPDDFPYTTLMGATYDSGDYDAALTEALRLAGYDAAPGRAGRAAPPGRPPAPRHRGGRLRRDHRRRQPGSEYGAVEVHADGTVTVRVGTSAHGQGHATAFAMLVADRLGIPMEAVRFVQSDTALVPSGGGTGGSRSLQLGGSAVARAAEAVLAAGPALAAQLLEASAGDIVVTDDGRLGVAGVPARALSWAELAVAGGEARATPLAGRAATSPRPGPRSPSAPTWRWSRSTPRPGWCGPSATSPSTTAAGSSTRSSSPASSTAASPRGIAQALWEDVVYDDDGNPLTATLADYAMPSAAELPSFEAVDTETPTPLNPLGAKGIGESGTIGLDARRAERRDRRPQPPRRPPPRHALHPGAGLAGDPRPPPIPRGNCHLGASRRRCSRRCRGPARRVPGRVRRPTSETSLQVAALRPGIMAEPRSERQERHEICRNCDRPSTAAWYRGESRSECSTKSPAPPRNNGAFSEVRCGVGLAASTPRTVRGATPRWDGLNPPNEIRGKAGNVRVPPGNGGGPNSGGAPALGGFTWPPFSKTSFDGLMVGHPEETPLPDEVVAPLGAAVVDHSGAGTCRAVARQSVRRCTDTA